MPRFRSFIFAALLIATACGDDASGPSTPTNYAGTWTSNGNLSTGQAFVFTMVLTQTDANVTGTGQVVGLINNGTITGTVAGNKLTFQFAITQPCVATFSGTTTVNGRNISGNISGTASCLGTVQATFSGLKQGS
jgi:hypothetical protein